MNSYSLVNLEPTLNAIHKAADIVGADKWEKRRVVARAFGYEDSKFIVYLFETKGFPLEEAAHFVAKSGLKVDVEGLRHELLMIGMNARTVELQLELVTAAHRESAKLHSLRE